MKKTFVAICTVMASMFVAPSFAQQDAAAKNLLAQVSKKYDSFSTIQSEFSLIVTKGNQTVLNDKGNFSLDKKTNRYNIKSGMQHLISDGKSVWNIMPNQKEVEVNTADNNGKSINATNLFSFYKTGYKYVQAANEKVGAAVMNVVELTPVDTKSNYFKIKLRVNQTNKMIYDATVFDKGGMRYTYVLKNQQTNKALANSLFTFNKADYKTYEIVDLR